MPIAKSREAAQWDKNNKISKSDFTELRDEAQFNNWMENTETLLKTKELGHIIEHGHVPKDRDLDNAQQKWMYGILMNCLIAAKPRSICKDHLATMNARAV